MIKSKIEARERALELAVNASKSAHTHASTIVLNAKEFESYLIGDAELPETEPSTEDAYTKAFTSALAAAYGCGAIKSDDVPCKSEAE